MTMQQLRLYIIPPPCRASDLYSIFNGNSNTMNKFNRIFDIGIQYSRGYSDSAAWVRRRRQNQQRIDGLRRRHRTRLSKETESGVWMGIEGRKMERWQPLSEALNSEPRPKSKSKRSVCCRRLRTCQERVSSAWASSSTSMTQHCPAPVYCRMLD